jgi:hypothetical protein
MLEKDKFMKEKLHYKMIIILVSFFLFFILVIPVHADFDEIVQKIKDAVIKPAPIDVSNFDVNGIKLGMSEEEVRTLFPSAKNSALELGENTFLKSKFKITIKDDKTFSNITVSIANAKYGHGVIKVEYITDFERNESLLFADIKVKIQKKYGKPNDESSEMQEVWHACYGNCNSLEKWLRVYLDSSKLYLTLNDGQAEVLWDKEKQVKSEDIKF